MPRPKIAAERLLFPTCAETMVGMHQLLTIVFLTIAANTTAPPLANAAEPRVVRATGTCLRKLPADRGTIVITADFLDRDLKTSIRRATEAAEAAKKRIRNLALTDLELSTTEYSVLEAKEWQKDRQVSKGFRTRIGLLVSTSDIKRIGEVIPIAADQEIRDIGQVATGLSEEKYKHERAACLKEAVEDARLKAERMAEGARAKLGGPVRLQELSGGGPPPPTPKHFRTEMAALSDAGGVPAPSIEAGRQALEVSVEADFELSR